MPEYCINLRSGSDAADGSSWANAWKTITSGATAARIAPGDTIKLAKSAVTSLGDATWTGSSATVTLASAATKNISLCENTTGWTAATNITPGNNTTYFNQGSKSLSIAVGSSFTTGNMIYLDLGSSGLDLSGHDAICFWVRSSAAVSAGVISIITCSNQDGTGAIDTFDIGALVANRGTIVVLRKASGNLGTVKSVAFYANSDPGTPTLYVDNIFAFNQSTPLHLGTPIGKNDGKWWAIRSIDETTVILGSPFSSSYDGKYYGTSGSAPSCSLDAYEVTASQVAQESGTAGSLESYIGGYNSSTGSRDGITWCYPRDCVEAPSFLNTNNKNYLGLGYVGSSYMAPLKVTGGDASGCEVNDICISANVTGLIPSSSASYKLIGCKFSGTIVMTACMQSAAFYLFPVRSASCYGDADFEFYGNGSTTSSFLLGISGHLHRLSGAIKLYICSGTGYGMSVGDANNELSDAFIANVEIYGITGTYIALAAMYTHGIFEIGTLTLDGCTSSRNLALGRSNIRIGNLVLANSSSASFYTNTTYDFYSGKIFVDRLNEDGRWKMYSAAGSVTDQITGGQNAAWARGGSGLCLYFDPGSQTYPLLWHCYAPVTVDVAQTLQFYVKKTSSGANPTMAINISGCGVDIAQESVTLTDSWALHTSAEFTPTCTGMVRIDFFAYDGSTTGDIGIDDISLVAS